MIEKAMFYSEYETMNNNGVSVEGFIEVNTEILRRMIADDEIDELPNHVGGSVRLLGHALPLYP